MKDVKKPCGRCRHDHRYGILRYSQDGVPLYGAHRCETRGCMCGEFIEAVAGNLDLPAAQVKELWAKTSFMSAQAPAATRMAVAQIMALSKDDAPAGFWGRLFGQAKPDASAMEKQWPEFMGLMISQISDIRGAMNRDESKFAHLVAHTDEVVESMRGVAQLNERLGNLWQAQRANEDRLANLERGMLAIAEALNVTITKSELLEETVDATAALESQMLRGTVAPNHLDEPIETEGKELKG